MLFSLRLVTFSHRLRQEENRGATRKTLNIFLSGCGAMGRWGTFLVQRQEIKDKGRR